MAIINPDRSGKKIKISVHIDSALHKRIEEYCDFADIDDLGYFFEEATRFIFRRDRKWKNHQKNIRVRRKNRDVETV